MNKTKTKLLNDFHINLLRRIQCLPVRTALPAVHLLLEVLPLEPELHKRHLSLLFSSISSQSAHNKKHCLQRNTRVVSSVERMRFWRNVILLMSDTPAKLDWKRLKNIVQGFSLMKELLDLHCNTAVWKDLKYEKCIGSGIR